MRNITNQYYRRLASVLEESDIQNRCIFGTPGVLKTVSLLSVTFKTLKTIVPLSFQVYIRFISLDVSCVVRATPDKKVHVGFLEMTENRYGKRLNY